MRVRAPIRPGTWRASVIANATTVMIAERPSRSAMIQTANVPMNCSTMETWRSCTRSMLQR